MSVPSDGEVDVWGSIDPDVVFESFAMATEEDFEKADPPEVNFEMSPHSVRMTQTFNLTAIVRNDGDVALAHYGFRLILPTQSARQHTVVVPLLRACRYHVEKCL